MSDTTDTGQQSRKSARRQLAEAAENLMEDEVASIVTAIITEAKKGDLGAAKIILDRIMPARRDRLVSFRVPRIETAADLVAALGSVVEAVAAAELTPAEAAAIAGILETRRRAIETVELAARVADLEQQRGAVKP